MAQITTFKDKEDKTLYPITSSKAVLDENGVDLDTRLAGKVDKVADKGLSANDYTNEDKTKLSSLPSSAELTAQLASKQDTLTTSDDLNISTDNLLSLTDMAKKRLFIDMWNTLCGTYGEYDPDNAPDPEHPFMGNNLWLTYEEALDCYRNYSRNANQSEVCRLVCRTNIPIPFNWNGIYERFAQGNTSIETAVIPRVASTVSLLNAFYGCSKLRECTIIGGDVGVGDVGGMFYNCISLEVLRFTSLSRSLSLAQSPLLTSDSLAYLATYRKGSGAITITVHPDVYAKLTDESNTEWNQVLLDAAEKNIQFATA